MVTLEKFGMVVRERVFTTHKIKSKFIVNTLFQKRKHKKLEKKKKRH